MNSLVLKGGRVIDPSQGLDEVADVSIVAGRVVGVGPGLEARDGQEVIDVTGRVVAPGFIDLHVHLREPGFEYKETIDSGLKAAVAGGFTAVCPMANTDPVNDQRSVTEFILRRAEEADLARVFPVGAVSKGLRGESLAEMGEMYEAGAVAFSDDGKPVVDGGLMRRALEYSRIFDVPIVAHSECPDLSMGGCMNESEISTRLGLGGIPSASEEAMVARDVILARLTKGRLHVAHLSARGSLDQVRRARAEGLAVTCEVTPHHLVLDDGSLLDRPCSTDLKMYPPLRSAADVEALIEGLVDGTIDAIATDHAPHHADEKALDFPNAPNGITGLETAVALVHDRLVRKGVIDLTRMVELFSTGPARVFGLEGGSLAVGARADVTIIDTARRFTVNERAMRSRSSNSPFLGWRLVGRPTMTIVAGRIVWQLK